MNVGGPIRRVSAPNLFLVHLRRAWNGSAQRATW